MRARWAMRRTSSSVSAIERMFDETATGKKGADSAGCARLAAKCAVFRVDPTREHNVIEYHTAPFESGAAPAARQGRMLHSRALHVRVIQRLLFERSRDRP